MLQSLLNGRLFAFRRGVSPPNAQGTGINPVLWLFSPGICIDFSEVNRQDL